jgi:hypothetical protein
MFILLILSNFCVFQQTLTIVIGILLAQIINLLIAQDVPEGFTDAQILAS